MVHYFFLNIFVIVSVYTLFGTGGLKFHMAYAAWKVTFLEAGNYGEHYGLERTKDANGVYESIRCQHSWNAVSSPMFFRIQRHSDHHSHVYRPYQVLRKFGLAPQLPYCYV